MLREDAWAKRNGFADFLDYVQQYMEGKTTLEMPDKSDKK